MGNISNVGGTDSLAEVTFDIWFTDEFHIISKVGNKLFIIADIFGNFVLLIDFYCCAGTHCCSLCTVFNHLDNFFQITEFQCTDIKQTYSSIGNGVVCSSAFCDDTMYSGIIFKMQAHCINCIKHLNNTAERVCPSPWKCCRMCWFSMENIFNIDTCKRNVIRNGGIGRVHNHCCVQTFEYAFSQHQDLAANTFLCRCADYLQYATQIMFLHDFLENYACTGRAGTDNVVTASVTNLRQCIVFCHESNVLSWLSCIVYCFKRGGNSAYTACNRKAVIFQKFTQCLLSFYFCESKFWICKNVCRNFFKFLFVRSSSCLNFLFHLIFFCTHCSFSFSFYYFIQVRLYHLSS